LNHPVYIVCKMKGMDYCGDFCSHSCPRIPLLHATQQVHSQL